MDAGSIESAIAIGFASKLGSATFNALWERVKDKIRREKPSGAAILEYFEQSPEKMVEPLRLLLEELRVAEDEKIAELAGTVVGEIRINQKVTAEHAVLAGQDIRSVYQANTINTQSSNKRGRPQG
jgi:hypothetical protein